MLWAAGESIVVVFNTFLLCILSCEFALIYGSRIGMVSPCEEIRPIKLTKTWLMESMICKKNPDRKSSETYQAPSFQNKSYRKLSILMSALQTDA